MPAPRMYKTEAIILRQRRFGEADRFLTVYTPTIGKLEVKARGVRKTTSRMSGHLQPLTRCMLQIAQGRVTDVVAGCETLESFQPLRDDLERLSRALYVVELIDRMVPERVHGYPTYRLLHDTMRRLAGPDDLDQVLRFFEMRLVDQCGFRPELENCAGCGSALEPVENFFSPLSGGVVCQACVAGLTGTRELSVSGLKVLRLLQRASYNDVVRIRIDVQLADEVERHLRSYIVSVLERDVNSAGFIERLRREGARQSVEV
jgi:DNA repair protein RecO (recombination protein O)